MSEVFVRKECRHSKHAERHTPGDRAMFIVRKHCPYCSRERAYPVCLSGWEKMGLSLEGVRCAGCGVMEQRDTMLTIIEVLGGPR